MQQEFQMAAKTFRGLEEVLAKELVNLGANNVSIERRVVHFTGDKRLLYKANLYCRTASRILKPIASFRANNADEVYAQVKSIDWSQYLDVKQTFAIDATVFSEEFRHSKFVTYRVKDAIADWFMERENKRPSIRLDNPDLFLNVHISHTQCTISLDSSGDSLHKRGYRDAQTEAPINEALAAGMLLLAGWEGQSDFVDPMCGSGTFLIEAALIALNIPPCIYRQSFAFEKWKDFDKELFEELYNDDSLERPFKFKIRGADVSPRAVKIAQENIKAAGLTKYITVEQRSVADWEVQTEKTLVVTNPPYGERILSDDLFGLYAQLGDTLKHKFTGSTAWVISSHISCLQRVGLRPSEKVKLLNGALDCEFWKYELFRGKRNDFVAKKKDRRSSEK
ncbi:MAG TPA: THUMP domain-containing protein [Paludibacteraceae bacterium]|nr:THUMP domain-containing protein [Paludibacteraceae bacterium]